MGKPALIDISIHEKNALENIGISMDELLVYQRYKKGNKIFNSKSYTRAKKSIDFFIQMNDEQCTMGMAAFYFIYCDQTYVKINLA